MTIQMTGVARQAILFLRRTDGQARFTGQRTALAGKRWTLERGM